MWDSQVLPRLTDILLSGRPIDDLRAAALAPARGEVLELGFGTGTNLRHYPEAVTVVHAVEPSETAWRLSEKHRQHARPPVIRAGLDGATLSAPDASFDTVVSTFTLCTIPEVEEALRQVRRVLRPGGRLCLLEHGLSPDAGTAAWQRRLEPTQRLLGGGCHLTRDPLGLVRAAGLRIESADQRRLTRRRAMAPWTFMTRAVAVNP